MNRSMLDELLLALSPIAGERELVMVGSQAIHAITSDVPIEVVMSRECDLLLDESDPLTTVIDQQLGLDSPRATETSVYELIAVLLDRELAGLAAVRDRIAAVPDLHMRAVLAARLQIVLQSAR